MPDQKYRRTFTAGVRLGHERMRSVLEAGRILNSTNDLDGVLTAILNESVKELNSETGTVFLVNDDHTELVSRVVEGGRVKEISVPINKGLAGATYKSKSILNISDPYNDKRFDKSFDDRTGFRTRNILSIPIFNRNGDTIGVIQVLNKKTGEFDHYDEEFAAIFATFSAIAVENAKQLQYVLERERLEKELDLAEKIQSTFLQGEIPEFVGYDIAAYSSPCYQIGGDYMRLAQLNRQEYLALIADVSGKGIPAALITLAMHAYIKVLLPSDEGIDESKIPVSSRREYPILLNDLLLSVTAGRAYATFCAVIINNKDNNLTFCNCGHTKPIIVRKNGAIERIDAGAPVLGILPSIDLNIKEIKLKSDDLVCMFTDGIDEAASGPEDDYGNRDEFGTERLINILSDNRSREAEEIRDAVIRNVEEFICDYHKEDDITLIVIKKN